MTHRRREFSNSVKRAARERAAGLCECHRVAVLPTFGVGCGSRLGPGNIFYEHVDPDGLMGAPTLSNCAVLSKTCWKLKSASYDIPIVAKAKRNQDRHSGIGRAVTHRMPGGRGDRIKQKIGGQIVNRFTGQPLSSRRWVRES